MQSDAAQLKFAKELHERIRREFPEVRSEYYLCAFVWIDHVSREASHLQVLGQASR